MLIREDRRVSTLNQGAERRDENQDLIIGNLRHVVTCLEVVEHDREGREVEGHVVRKDPAGRDGNRPLDPIRDDFRAANVSVG